MKCNLTDSFFGERVTFPPIPNQSFFEARWCVLNKPPCHHVTRLDAEDIQRLDLSYCPTQWFHPSHDGRPSGLKT